MKQLYLINGHIELSFCWHKQSKAYSCNSDPYKNVYSSYWIGWIRFHHFRLTFKYIWKREVFLSYYEILTLEETMRNEIDLALVSPNPVSLMAELMEARLREYDHWSGWDNMSRNELAGRILKNLSGILDAKREINSEEYDLAFEKYIRDQSADIGNFAMMLAVNFGELKEIKMDERQDERKGSTEEQTEEKIEQMKDQTVNPEHDPQTKGTQETEEVNTAKLKESFDLSVLRKELEETFGMNVIERLKRIVAEHPEDVGKSWKSPLIDLTVAGAEEPSVPYQCTMERLDTIGILANDLTSRLDPILAGEETVTPAVNQDTITQIDGKLASIHLALSNLYHRIQL